MVDYAEARRGGFSSRASKASTRSLPVIVPISVGSTSVVFVKELPDMPAFRFEGKAHFDLGYKFGRFGGGEWVGYVKDKSSYVKLNQDVVKSKLLPMVGLTDADAPKRDSGSMAMVGLWWLAAALGVFGLLTLRFPFLRRIVHNLRGRTDEDEAQRSRSAEPSTRTRMRAAPAGAVSVAGSTPAYGAPAAFGKRR